MAHTLVKITVDDNGEKQDTPVWHLLETDGGGHHALCTGEFVGTGESACVYKTREVQRGIPCQGCREIIERHKSIVP